MANIQKYLVAKVDYQAIVEDGEGIYIWLNPDEESTTEIMHLLRNAPFKTKDCTELHCTVMHCTTHLPQTVNIPEDQVYNGSVAQVTPWVDHKGRNILVLSIASQGLQGLHSYLAKQYLTHGHDAFNPHITIAKDIPMTAEERLWIEETNERLVKNPLEIAFSPQLRAAPIS